MKGLPIQRIAEGLIKLKNVRITLWFDTEDYINPESDEALSALLEMLQEKNIKASFNIVGERARVLQQRGREDILEKLRNHEAGYHTDFHSAHPTIAEYLEEYGFRLGALEYELRERTGFSDVQDIITTNLRTYSQPGSAYAPQAYLVLRKWGIKVNLGQPHPISCGNRPFWYCGILQITDIEMRMELEEGGLEGAKAQFEEIYTSAPDDELTVVSIYYHPCEFINTEFWDAVNFSYGENPSRDEWVAAAHRSMDEMWHYVNELGQFIDFTLQKPGVAYVPASDLAANDGQTVEYTKGDVEKLASLVGGEIGFVKYKGSSLSASELLSLFVKYLDNQPLNPELWFGPESDVISEGTLGEIGVGDILEAIHSASFSYVFDAKQIPDSFLVKGKRIHPSDFAGTLAAIIRQGLTQNDKTAIHRTRLQSEDYVTDVDINETQPWIIFPKGFKTPNLLQLSRLQSWTLKPL